MQKILTFFFSKNISKYAVFNDQSFNDTLTNDIVSFEKLGPDLQTAMSNGIYVRIILDTSGMRRVHMSRV